MKTLLVILIFTLTNTLISQELKCDTVLLVDGSRIIGQIQSETKKEYIYFRCCEECLVPRKLKKKDIDKLILTASSQNRLKTATLVFTKIGTNKTKELKSGSNVIVLTRESKKIKGIFRTVGRDSILVGGFTFALNDLKAISKTKTKAALIGNSVGITLLVSAIFSEKNYGEHLILAGLSIPFFALNAIKKKYDLEKTWKVEIK